MSGVAAAHHLAAEAGATQFDAGGGAVDAAVAAAAVMAVTSPHMCGLGGDLFALVHAPGAEPVALNASGRAGAGADPAALRRAGHDRMPFRGDIRSVTVPGCADGLLALAQRFGRRPLADVLAPAVALAEHGFPISPTLAGAGHALTPALRERAFGTADPLREGTRLTVPGVGRALRAIAEGGRGAFYEGPVGAELRALGAGLFTEVDLRTPSADWVDPLSAAAFGHTLWTIPPNSQGYLTLAAAWIADAVGVVADPADERWAFGLIEAARQAAHDRVAVLHDRADGPGLVSPSHLRGRALAIGARAGAGLTDVHADGETTYLCAVDGEHTGVSLILSNAAGFGAHLVLPESGIFLHNRGIGFSLAAGHPAEYGPGRRPPHTLSPALVTRSDGSLRTVLGTMGGDAQPQILLQLLARTLRAGEDAQPAITAPRWALSREPTSGFDTWDDRSPPLVRVESEAPPGWARGLRARGYEVAVSAPGDGSFGHAQMIERSRAGAISGAADPRALSGAFVER